jgi:hypothetical protein
LSSILKLALNPTNSSVTGDHVPPLNNPNLNPVMALLDVTVKSVFPDLQVPMKAAAP